MLSTQRQNWTLEGFYKCKPAREYHYIIQISVQEWISAIVVAVRGRAVTRVPARATRKTTNICYISLTNIKILQIGRKSQPQWSQWGSCICWEWGGEGSPEGWPDWQEEPGDPRVETRVEREWVEHPGGKYQGQENKAAADGGVCWVSATEPGGEEEAIGGEETGIGRKAMMIEL